MVSSDPARRAAGLALLLLLGSAVVGCAADGARGTGPGISEVPSARHVAASFASVGRPAPTASARGAAAGEELSSGSNPLPADSALTLPPMIHLVVDSSDGARDVVRINAVLRSKRLALAPNVRRAVRAGETNTSALDLLLRLSRAQSPLLVFAARGRRVRVQATSLAATRDLVTALRDTAGPSVQLELRPVRPDFADLAQSKAEARGADIAARAVAIALSQVGVPYSWGGGNANGPTTGTCAGYHGSIRPCPATRTVGFDCSGLTLFAYAQVGVTLDHYAAFQWLEGVRVEVKDLIPGDLVFFNPKADGPGHMGMYVGNGAFVQAPQTGDVVKVSSLADYARSYMGAVRPR